jgi:hypothetical protein
MLLAVTRRSGEEFCDASDIENAPRRPLRAAKSSLRFAGVEGVVMEVYPQNGEEFTRADEES